MKHLEHREVVETRRLLEVMLVSVARRRRFMMSLRNILTRLWAAVGGGRGWRKSGTVKNALGKQESEDTELARWAHGDSSDAFIDLEAWALETRLFLKFSNLSSADQSLFEASSRRCKLARHLLRMQRVNSQISRLEVWPPRFKQLADARKKTSAALVSQWDLTP